MATIRLIPSTYYLSNSSYLSVSNVSNMYTNTDSTTHGTVTHERASTNSTYYMYLRGFNFNDLPSEAEVSDFTIKLKASATGHTTSTSTYYYMTLAKGTAEIDSTYADGRLSTTTGIFTFSKGRLEWNYLVTNGETFGIRIPLRRASSSVEDVVSIYGAEIEVTYTLPTPATVTSSLVGNGQISPSGATSTYEGREYELSILPPTGYMYFEGQTVTATKNGADITSQLVAHGVSLASTAVLGTYTLISGGFNGSGASYFEGIVGHGVDATQTTSNYYSSSSSTHAVFQYAMPITAHGTIVEDCYCKVNGHAESTSNASEYMCVQLKSGSTDISEQINFKDIGTSNTTITLQANPLPTIAQLQSMVLECTLGYYGGAINGATLTAVTSDGSGNISKYTYTYTVDGDATIIVTITEGGSTSKLYIKRNGAWQKVTMYQKGSLGAWSKVNDPTTVLSTLYKYVKEN